MTLKLGPIPDRSPVKLSLTLAPETHDALSDYAALYAQTYGKEAALPDLAALMIEKFLDGDRKFKRARKALRAPLAKEESAASR